MRLFFAASISSEASEIIRAEKRWSGRNEVKSSTYNNALGT